jgi:glycosyltransferase involved in cell wall biosynthesis
MIHITPEILDFNIGGIGTVLSELYRNRGPRDRFVYVQLEKQRPVGLPKDIGFICYKDYLNSLPVPGIPMGDEDVVCIHHLGLMKPNVPKKTIFVSHSNIFLESQINPLTGQSAVEQFYSSLGWAKEIVCVSESERQLLLKTCGKIVSGKKIHVIHNGVEPVNNPLFQETGIFGYIGRMDIRKGLFHLIENFPVSETLYLATGGRDKYLTSSLHRLVQSCKYSPNKQIYPLGFCGGERKRQFFESIECLIIPSLYEPFGMNVLEACEMNRPIIAARVGGLREILGDQHPLYFDPTDFSTLRQVIQKYKSLFLREKEEIIRYQRNRLKLFGSALMAQKYHQLESANR